MLSGSRVASACRSWVVDQQCSVFLAGLDYRTGRMALAIDNAVGEQAHSLLPTVILHIEKFLALRLPLQAFQLVPDLI